MVKNNKKKNTQPTNFSDVRKQQKKQARIQQRKDAFDKALSENNFDEAQKYIKEFQLCNMPEAELMLNKMESQKIVFHQQQLKANEQKRIIEEEENRKKAIRRNDELLDKCDEILKESKIPNTKLENKLNIRRSKKDRVIELLGDFDFSVADNETIFKYADVTVRAGNYKTGHNYCTRLLKAEPKNTILYHRVELLLSKIHNDQGYFKTGLRYALRAEQSPVLQAEKNVYIQKSMAYLGLHDYANAKDNLLVITNDPALNAIEAEIGKLTKTPEEYREKYHKLNEQYYDDLDLLDEALFKLGLLEFGAEELEAAEKAFSRENIINGGLTLESYPYKKISRTMRTELSRDGSLRAQIKYIAIKTKRENCDRAADLALYRLGNASHIYRSADRNEDANYYDKEARLIVFWLKDRVKDIDKKKKIEKLVDEPSTFMEELLQPFENETSLDVLVNHAIKMRISKDKVPFNRKINTPEGLRKFYSEDVRPYLVHENKAYTNFLDTYIIPMKNIGQNGEKFCRVIATPDGIILNGYPFEEYDERDPEKTKFARETRIEELAHDGYIDDAIVKAKEEFFQNNDAKAALKEIKKISLMKMDDEQKTSEVIIYYACGEIKTSEYLIEKYSRNCSAKAKEKYESISQLIDNNKHEKNKVMTLQ